MSELFSKTSEFKAFLSGDYECFCFAVSPEDCLAAGFEWKSLHTNWFHSGLMSVYIDDILPELPDHKQMYRFKIIIEAEPISEVELLDGGLVPTEQEQWEPVTIRGADCTSTLAELFPGEYKIFRKREI